MLKSEMRKIEKLEINEDVMKIEEVERLEMSRYGYKPKYRTFRLTGLERCVSCGETLTRIYEGGIRDTVINAYGDRNTGLYCEKCFIEKERNREIGKCDYCGKPMYAFPIPLCDCPNYVDPAKEPEKCKWFHGEREPPFDCYYNYMEKKGMFLSGERKRKNND